MKIHQYIPLKHIVDLCKRGLHFSPCGDFVDKLEFRYGYCFFECGASSSRTQLDECIAASFAKSEVNTAIQQSHISCWTRSLGERHAMWEIYGRAEAAIRISVDSDAILNALAANAEIAGAAGSVTYGFNVSLTAPQFLTPFGVMKPGHNERYHLFFHKHEFYRWEEEYRFVLLSGGHGIQLDARQFITDVVMSPFNEMPNDKLELLQKTFGSRLRSSSLVNPYV